MALPLWKHDPKIEGRAQLKDGPDRTYAIDQLVFIMIILGALSGGNMAVRKDGSGGFARALKKRYSTMLHSALLRPKGEVAI